MSIFIQDSEWLGIDSVIDIITIYGRENRGNTLKWPNKIRAHTEEEDGIIQELSRIRS